MLDKSLAQAWKPKAIESINLMRTCYTERRRIRRFSFGDAMKFYITLPEPKLALGSESQFSFSANGVDEFAAQLQRAISDSTYIQSWFNHLDAEDAESVSPDLLEIDSSAKVTGEQHDLSFSFVINTQLNGTAFKHRMRMLAGSNWQLTDVK